MKYFLSREEVLTQELLVKILQKNKQSVANLRKLFNYYCGKTEILNRKVVDANKPNHKIAHPYASYITDTLCGYFVGKPITYSSTDEDLSLELSAILNYNDVAAQDMSIARDVSIYGKGFELHYTDFDGVSRFTKVPATDMIIIYDDTIEKEILYAIRIVPTFDIKTEKLRNKVEVYSSDSITYYESNDSLTELKMVDELPHYYGMVPVVEYVNNEQEMGDFESVIPLIDAYDNLESDALNDFDYFVDAYLLLTGMDADSESIAQMKENRVILLDDSSAKAEWLIKSESDTVSENLKNRFKMDIHKFSKTPDLSDEAFSNNASGIAIKYKLYGTESLVANKERFFKKGLQRRLELLCNILNLKGSNYDYRNIEMTFVRNIPNNDSESAEMVQKLAGLVSTETLLGQLPFITDVQAEMEKRANTEEVNFYEFER